MLTTLDGPTVVDYPSPRHEVFETLDVGASNYMRFFIDSAVLPTIGWLDHYKNINYVGLSGGATVGLPACVLLKNVIKNCILVAGIMPLDLRVKYPEYILGDAEQITQSFHRIASVREMIAELKREKSNLVLMYNDEDPCCFQKKEALDFKNSLGTEAPPFFIRHASAHEYDPEQILDILQ